MKESKREKIKFSCLFAGLIISVFLAFVFICWMVFEPRWSAPKDAIIVSAITRAGYVIYELKSNEGNYDSFNCENKKMETLCKDIAKNYGEKPIIAHDSIRNSQKTCIYSPLVYMKNYWFCVDSTGSMGYVSIDPGSDGYCMDGKDAICPHILGTISL